MCVDIRLGLAPAPRFLRLLSSSHTILHLRVAGVRRMLPLLMPFGQRLLSPSRRGLLLLPSVFCRVPSLLLVPKVVSIVETVAN